MGNHSNLTHRNSMKNCWQPLVKEVTMHPYTISNWQTINKEAIDRDIF